MRREVSGRVASIITRADIPIDHAGENVSRHLGYDTLISGRYFGMEFSRSNPAIVQLKFVKFLRSCLAFVVYALHTNMSAARLYAARQCREGTDTVLASHHTRIAASQVFTLSAFDFTKLQPSSLFLTRRSPHSLSKVLGM